MDSFIPSEQETSSVEAFKKAVQSHLKCLPYGDDEDEWDRAFIDYTELRDPNNVVEIQLVRSQSDIPEDLNYEVIDQIVLAEDTSDKKFFKPPWMKPKPLD